MMIPDWKIVRSDMLDPMEAEQNKSMGPSYGPSPYGYDCKLGSKYIPEFIKIDDYIYDDKTIGDTFWIDNQAYRNNTENESIDELKTTITIKPKEFLLCETVEHFDMPNDVVGLVFDKSTYARKGIAAFNTVIEPGWKGCLTLELVNHSNKPQELVIGAGIVQVIFFKNPISCEHPYDGKYQGDKGVQVAK